ncbi:MULTISPECIES: alkaline phosphatase family protein [unclassified Carboxylicivirga]|uniref:alkaline phosphatase family protein n=1 Tax=Carboxylicivirga TaxID=1628153 RepID=UPI003D358DCB
MKTTQAQQLAHIAYHSYIWPPNMVDMIKKAVLFFILLLSIAHAGQSQKVASSRPKLVVFILVDQLSTEQIVAFRDQFSDNGFNRLINGGAFYRNAAYTSASSYFGTNLATLSTGCHPATHGIVSDWWYDRVRKKEINAAYGEINPLPDTPRQQPSARLLQTSTISDELKWMYNQRARISVIGINPSHLVWSGGHAPDYLYRVNPHHGDIQLISPQDSSLKAPEWVQQFNDKQLLQTYSSRTWGPLKDLRQYHQMRYFSDQRANAKPFLYTLDKQEGVGAYIPVIHSPYGNKLIRDFAMAQIINEELGKGPVTDVLTLHFTARTVHGKLQGGFDAETQDMLMRLDEEIANLLKNIDQEVGLENTLVALTSVSAPIKPMEDIIKQNIPTGLFSGDKAASLANLFLMAKYGQGKWVMTYNDGQIYLNHDLIAERKVNREEMKKEAARFLSDMQGVTYAIPLTQLQYTAANISSYNSLKHNYHPDRSGDIAIKVQPGWYEELSDGRRIKRNWSAAYLPLIFYGWKINPQDVYQAISMTRFAPTVCSFLEIPFPNGCEGEPLPNLIY